MIDFDLEIKNVQPINIKNMELKKYRINDNTIKSIILYNKAIAEIRTKELDLAIKDLKKALFYNKGFAEAIKLLGLCYVNNKEYKMAEKTFEKLVKYEIYSELSKEYIKKLLVNRNMSKTLDVIRRVKDRSNDGKKQSILSRYSRGKIIIGFSISTILITAFVISYWMPLMLQTSSAKVETTNKLVSSEKKTDENIGENLDKNKSVATISYEQYEDIQKKLDDTKSELDNYKIKYDILLMLDEVEKSYKVGNYEKAASDLLHIKNMKFDNEAKIKFDKLWLEIKTTGIWPIYNQGNKLYKEGKYKEALTKIKIVSELDPSLDLMPWITYQIGMCYKETNNNASALVFFQKVKDNYPKSDYAWSAERIINEIGNKK